MTYGNFAALAQRNLKRMLAYSSIAHAGYMLVGVAAAGVSIGDTQSRPARSSSTWSSTPSATSGRSPSPPGWSRDKRTDDIDDLNGLGCQHPVLAICILSC